MALLRVLCRELIVILISSYKKNVCESCGADASAQSNFNSTAMKQTSYYKLRNCFLLSKMFLCNSSRSSNVFCWTQFKVARDFKSFRYQETVKMFFLMSLLEPRRRQEYSRDYSSFLLHKRNRIARSRCAFVSSRFYKPRSYNQKW